MSIAVRAVICPSVRLRLLQAGFAGCSVAAAWRLVETGAFHLAWAGAAASLLAGLFLMHSLFQNRTTRCLDISPVGRIRVTVYQHMDSAGEGGAVLLAGSTLWPGLLLLRLRDADGRLSVLQVWPGDVADGVFRPLAVAFRVIAARAVAGE